jgi:hypothetical protein
MRGCRGRHGRDDVKTGAPKEWPSKKSARYSTLENYEIQDAFVQLVEHPEQRRNNIIRYLDRIRLKCRKSNDESRLIELGKGKASEKRRIFAHTHVFIWTSSASLASGNTTRSSSLKEIEPGRENNGRHSTKKMNYTTRLQTWPDTTA